MQEVRGHWWIRLRSMGEGVRAQPHTGRSPADLQGNRYERRDGGSLWLGLERLCRFLRPIDESSCIVFDIGNVRQKVALSFCPNPPRRTRTPVPKEKCVLWQLPPFSGKLSEACRAALLGGFFVALERTVAPPRYPRIVIYRPRERCACRPAPRRRRSKPVRSSADSSVDGLRGLRDIVPVKIQDCVPAAHQGGS